ncbi:MAG: hypothetical protein KY467_10555 [Gemmatimonadetes bacterium]|nr:hypothetical protein [Gemmatimonadota bacterium]
MQTRFRMMDRPSPTGRSRARLVVRLLVPVLLLSLPAGGTAQEPAEPRPGSLLRVETPEGRYMGYLLASPVDSLVLQSRATDARFHIAVRDILYAEESLGRISIQGLLVKRAFQGGAVGAVAGALAGFYLQSEFGLKRVDLAILVGAQTGVIAGGISAVSEPRPERWRAIRIPGRGR